MSQHQFLMYMHYFVICLGILRPRPCFLFLIKYIKIVFRFLYILKIKNLLKLFYVTGNRKTFCLAIQSSSFFIFINFKLKNCCTSFCSILVLINGGFLESNLFEDELTRMLPIEKFFEVFKISKNNFFYPFQEFSPKCFIRNPFIKRATQLDFKAWDK